MGIISQSILTQGELSPLQIDLFKGWELHISDENILLSGLFVSWKCSVASVFLRRSLNSFKNFPLKVFVNWQVD